MSEENVFVIKDILQNRIGANKIVFRDENGKLDPIVFDNISIVGLFISDGGTLWLVDDTEVKHDMFGDLMKIMDTVVDHNRFPLFEYLEIQRGNCHAPYQ